MPLKATHTHTHTPHISLMDWYSWLSKTSLDPSLVYEYGLVFSHNELDEDDIPYLNHEFLQSMGISIAKHRLEILKLVRRERGNNLPPISRLVAAIKKTKMTLVEYIQTWVRRNQSSLVLVSKRTYSSRRKGSMLKKNNKNRQVLNMARQERLLLTSGSISSPMVYDINSNDKMDGYDDPYWSARVEEIRWDAMFQDLKPT